MTNTKTPVDRSTRTTRLRRLGLLKLPQITFKPTLVRLIAQEQARRDAEAKRKTKRAK